MMSFTSDVGSAGRLATSTVGHGRTAMAAARTQSSAGGDRVELTPKARAEMAEKPIRSELVSEIRQQIADGTYLTDEKLDAVVERLHRDLFRS